jgi:hypothetical protein
MFRTLTDPIQLSPDRTLEGRDIVVIPDQYLGLGSAYAVARVHAWFARRGKDSEIRFGNDLSFTDLRKTPAVLIGAFQNRWTLQLTRSLRFVFDTVNGIHGIRDTQTGKTWLVPNISEDGRTTEDYVIVSRIFDADTGQFLVAAAGLTQYGTRTAGDVVTNSSVLTEALKGAKPGWQNHNLQMLFHVQIIGHSPGSPKIIAVHAW